MSTTNTYRYFSCPTHSTLHYITSTTNTYHCFTSSCPTHNTLQNLTSTTNNYCYVSCSFPKHSKLLSLLLIFLSYIEQVPFITLHNSICARHAHITMHIQTTINIRVGPERSRVLPMSHVLQQSKYFLRVALGICEFKQH